MNKTLVESLSKYVDIHQEDWDKRTATVLFAYRTLAQSSTGYSYYELLFGRTAWLPVDTQLHHQLPSPDTTDEYLSKMKGNLRQSREILDQEVTAAQDRQHANYGGSKVALYEVGEFVLLLSPALTGGTVSKLYCSYQGPYQVMRQVGITTRSKLWEKERERENVFIVTH